MSPCKFLGGINFKQFLSTHQEWHALVEGGSDGFCAWRSRYEPDDERKTDIAKEHHYYNPGRALGFAGFIVLVTGMAVWFVTAVLGV